MHGKLADSTRFSTSFYLSFFFTRIWHAFKAGSFYTALQIFLLSHSHSHASAVHGKLADSTRFSISFCLSFTLQCICHAWKAGRFYTALYILLSLSLIHTHLPCMQSWQILHGSLHLSISLSHSHVSTMRGKLTNFKLFINVSEV
jgi:hypothetical protein